MWIHTAFLRLYLTSKLHLEMDDHFSKILEVNGSKSFETNAFASKALGHFIPELKFTGKRPGYAFKRGEQGLGYYYDSVQGVAPPQNVIFK